MRAVVDTNVLLSGLLWHGTPHALMDCVRSGTLTLVGSPVLLAELADALGRAKFDAILTRSDTSRERLLAEAQSQNRDSPILRQPPEARPD